MTSSHTINGGVSKGEIMETKSICKNCRHPIVKTTEGWLHIDSHKQPNYLCLRPVYGIIVMACGCKDAEPRKQKGGSNSSQA
jgi:hypothetical protein